MTRPPEPDLVEPDQDWGDQIDWVGADDLLACGLENPESCESCQ